MAFLLACGAAFGVALSAAERIEQRTVEIVQFSMREDRLDWVQVSADGLQLILEGTAPDEASRFRAISRAVSLVEGDRIVDRLQVVEADRFAQPPFALEMLRNDDGVSLIGLVPEGATVSFVDEMGMSESTDIVEMIETADYPVPELWDLAVEFGLNALRTLPRAKISVTEGRVEVEAVSRSPEERERFMSALEDAVPDEIDIVLDISAPRPVITPFSLRFVRTDVRARLEDCSADTESSQRRIIAAAREAGLVGIAQCDIGLGVPSPQWTVAVERAIEATTEIGTATLTFADADITLLAAIDTEQELFDRVVGELEAALPDVFSLTAILPEPSDPEALAGPPSFTATLSREGAIELRGRLPDERIEAAVEAFAGAHFGYDNVRLATRRVDDLPTGWSVRVLAGLAALAHLSNGDVRIEPDALRIRGETGSTSAVSDIARLLSDELGAAETFDIDVAYIEALDPASSIPSPEECADRIAAILEETKITFDPGSIEINDGAGAVLDRIAAVLPDCRHVPMQIGGHTDAQGRESMNLRLSQGRADAVLNGLLARNILVGNLSAVGYGETQPIADNETEEGREVNRRIEFRLMSEIEAERAVADALARAEELANLPRPSQRPGPDPEPEPQPELSEEPTDETPTQDEAPTAEDGETSAEASAEVSTAVEAPAEVQGETTETDPQEATETPNGADPETASAEPDVATEEAPPEAAAATEEEETTE